MAELSRKMSRHRKVGWQEEGCLGAQSAYTTFVEADLDSYAYKVRRFFPGPTFWMSLGVIIPRTNELCTESPSSSTIRNNVSPF